MEPIDADKRIYECETNEPITVTLEPSDTANFGAVYSFRTPGNPATQPAVGNKINFEMEGEELKLWITFVFQTANGTCRVKLKGKDGVTHTDLKTYENIANLPKTVRWIFRLAK